MSSEFELVLNEHLRRVNAFMYKLLCLNDDDPLRDEKEKIVSTCLELIRNVHEKVHAHPYFKHPSFDAKDYVQILSNWNYQDREHDWLTTFYDGLVELLARARGHGNKAGREVVGRAKEKRLKLTEEEAAKKVLTYERTTLNKTAYVINDCFSKVISLLYATDLKARAVIDVLRSVTLHLIVKDAYDLFREEKKHVFTSFTRSLRLFCSTFTEFVKVVADHNEELKKFDLRHVLCWGMDFCFEVKSFCKQVNSAVGPVFTVSPVDGVNVFLKAFKSTLTSSSTVLKCNRWSDVLIVCFFDFEPLNLQEFKNKVADLLTKEEKPLIGYLDLLSWLSTLSVLTALLSSCNSFSTKLVEERGSEVKEFFGAFVEVLASLTLLSHKVNSSLLFSLLFENACKKAFAFFKVFSKNLTTDEVVEKLRTDARTFQLLSKHAEGLKATYGQTLKNVAVKASSRFEDLEASLWMAVRDAIYGFTSAIETFNETLQKNFFEKTTLYALKAVEELQKSTTTQQGRKVTEDLYVCVRIAFRQAYESLILNAAEKAKQNVVDDLGCKPIVRL